MFWQFVRVVSQCPNTAESVLFNLERNEEERINEKKHDYKANLGDGILTFP